MNKAAALDATRRIFVPSSSLKFMMNSVSPFVRSNCCRKGEEIVDLIDRIAVIATIPKRRRKHVSLFIGKEARA